MNTFHLYPAHHRSNEDSRRTGDLKILCFGFLGQFPVFSRSVSYPPRQPSAVPGSRLHITADEDGSSSLDGCELTAHSQTGSL
ncbi:hypothetical protein BaRGS_00001439 [Batillaria attramentaria]|uniref:Uncharacterized protein n=1 Tax=Batillaria attramentaria TaxID=370345 RepID=A0ABD0M7W1_9CAEN